MPEFSYLNLTPKYVKEFNKLCPLNEYRVLEPASIPNEMLNLVPTGLWKKTDSLFLMSSGSAIATAYGMINCNRWDFKASAIDQEPIFFAHIGGSPVLDGIVIHHGNWPGRTTQVPPTFQAYLVSSGIGNHFPISSTPSTLSGSILTLGDTPQRGAFAAGLERVMKLI